jgi:uncharacterized membrane protein
MTEQQWYLIMASAAFVGSHLVFSHPPIRKPLREKFGKFGFFIFYSLTAGAALTWMVPSYGNASRTLLWEAPTFFRHGSLTVMLIAIFLIICGATTPNPGMMGMEKSGLGKGPAGVLKITRHPVMWGVALWAISHAIANGYIEGVIFFGSLALLALLGASHIDYRRTKQYGDQWRNYMAITSHVPFAAILGGRTRVDRSEFKWWQTLLTVAIYAGILIGHENFFGPNVMPL